MIETIHIFDEFSQAPDELTTEQRHKKRVALDPLLYDILKAKYGGKLYEFWQRHTLPKETDSYLVIVERRIHPNLAFTLYNMAYFARSWGLIIVCSDVNYEYCKSLCEPHCNSIHLLPLLQGNPEPRQGIEEYNTLLKSADFYKSLPGEHHLFFQVDSYLRKHIPEEWNQYDYIAAPYEWDETSMGGGLSYRKKESMIRICKEASSTIHDEDAFIMNGIHTLGMKIPPFELGITYVAESCIYEDPIGVHQWWTFFFPNQIEDAESIFHSLLSLEID
jgi:hypothetical protein